jgi:hypothetical protein
LLTLKGLFPSGKSPRENNPHQVNNSGCLHPLKAIIVYCSKTIKSLKIPKGGNQNPYIKEEQTTQWPKENVQKEK